MIENSWTLALIAVALLAIIGVIFFRFTGRKQPDLQLSQKERMFSSVLEKAVGGQYQIFCKVPMSDVLEANPELSERSQRKALKPVRSKVFDYLVCRAGNHEIVCAVELDDHSFDKKRFKKQDLFLEEICQQAFLPLLRVAPQNGYNLVEIIERFERTIAPAPPADAPVYRSKYRLDVKKRYQPQLEVESLSNETDRTALQEHS